MAWTVVVLLRMAAAQRPDLVELFYARQAYPVISSAFAETTARVPFSVAELITAALIVAAVVSVLWKVVRVVTGAASWRGFLAGLLKVAAIAANVVFLFDVLWGFNYARRTVPELLAFDMRPARPEELVEAAEALIGDAGVLRAGLPEGPDGALRLPDGVGGALHRVPAAFGPLLAPLPIPESTVPPKAPRSSALLSYLGIGGLFVPFTGEPQVNATLPDWEIPFTACHELAHQRGYAREDEANFVGYRACRTHPDADFRYSATFRAGLYVLAALAQANPREHDRVRATIPPPLGRDLAALAAWRERYKSRLADVQDRVNDAFLKGQGQKEGVQSYGRVVDLLLAERREARSGFEGAGPVR